MPIQMQHHHRWQGSPSGWRCRDCDRTILPRAAAWSSDCQGLVPALDAYGRLLDWADLEAERRSVA